MDTPTTRMRFEPFPTVWDQVIGFALEFALLVASTVICADASVAHPSSSIATSNGASEYHRCTAGPPDRTSRAVIAPLPRMLPRDSPTRMAATAACSQLLTSYRASLALF